MDIEKVYGEWIDFKNQDYKKARIGFEDWFSASSAGRCYKHQIYKINNAPEKPMEERSKRILRLGTLVHKDFEQAMKHYIKTRDDTSEFEFLIEHEIKIDKYKILGHLDLAIIDKENNKITVHDYKTSASYKWSLKFGRKTDKKPSFNYEMQLSTYAIGMENILDNGDINMSIIWYNKDTSRMREEVIAESFIEVANNYWSDLSDIRNDIGNGTDPNDFLSRDKDIGVPFQPWECRYCPYEHTCR